MSVIGPESITMDVSYDTGIKFHHTRILKFSSFYNLLIAKGRGVYFSSSVGRSSSCESLVTKERCEDASNDLKQLRAFIVTEIKTYENIIEGIKFEIQEKEEWLADIKNLIKSFYKTVVVGGFSERLKTITTSCFIHHMELRSKQLVSRLSLLIKYII
ncbi:unnamed protein product [Trichobilharzia regenti]|nr:unnamed protein product [Trichobilharzia regenti]